MKEKLLELLNNSYSPYSHFRVACIVITKDGKEYNGVNIENAAYGSTMCAERSAIYNAISNGTKKKDIERMYIMCDSDKISYSCFACRQVMSELMDSNAKVTFMNRYGDEESHTVSELCPYAFGEGDLK